MSGPVRSRTPQATVQAWRLSATPPIFIGPVRIGHPLGPASLLAPELGRKRAQTFAFVEWSLEDRAYLRNIIAAYRHCRDTYPEHRVTFLCPTERDVAALAASAIPAVFCSSNLLVREQAFRIMPDEPKTFDAIYVAAMEPYKRHELARELSRLALIYYDPETHVDAAYLRATRALLPNAVFVNEELARRGYARLQHPPAEAMANALLARRGHVNLSLATVALYCNRARTGLCLSAMEGAMRASVEYLLCGLPIVSTESVGGRDAFFEPEFCSVVASDPIAVYRAVHEIGRRAPAREEIRRRTLDKIVQHRAVLQSVLRSAFAREGIESHFDEAWHRFLAVDRFWRPVAMDALIDLAVAD
jgi:hypothetical protein